MSSLDEWLSSVPRSAHLRGEELQDPTPGMRGDWLGHYSSIKNPKTSHGFMENTGPVCAGQGDVTVSIWNILTLLPKYRSGHKVTQGLVYVVWEERETASREYWEGSPEIFLVRIRACSPPGGLSNGTEHVGPADVGPGDPVRCHLCGFSCPGDARAPGRSSAHLPAVFPFLLGVPRAE